MHSARSWPLFRVSCLQKLRDFHQLSAQALISDAEVEFEELARLPLRNEFTPILRFGGLLRLGGRPFLAFQFVEEPCDRDRELHGNAVESRCADPGFLVGAVSKLLPKCGG